MSQWFTKNGKKVGIISRGYKGIKSSNKPRIISKGEKAKDFGDEAVYMARESKALVCVCKDKLKAAKLLVRSGAEIIISDDGLQHYSLARDYEIAVIDSSRLLGNGYFLPAGPLRESMDRLKNVDLVLFNGRSKTKELVLEDTPTLHFNIRNNELVDLNNGSKHKLKELNVNEVRVLAGIGNPEKLYRKIEGHGMTVKPVMTEDHGMVNLENYYENLDHGFEKRMKIGHFDIIAKCTLNFLGGKEIRQSDLFYYLKSPDILSIAKKEYDEYLEENKKERINTIDQKGF